MLRAGCRCILPAEPLDQPVLGSFFGDRIDCRLLPLSPLEANYRAILGVPTRLYLGTDGIAAYDCCATCRPGEVTTRLKGGTCVPADHAAEMPKLWYRVRAKRMPEKPTSRRPR